MSSALLLGAVGVHEELADDLDSVADCCVVVGGEQSGGVADYNTGLLWIHGSPTAWDFVVGDLTTRSVVLGCQH